MSNRVLTLYYHRVIDIENDYNLLAVSPGVFVKQMMYLRDNYDLVSFDSDWRKIQSDAVCITFDDGYADNYLNVLPIIEELKIPVTIFISTGTMDQKRELWWDELEKYLLTGDSFPEYFQLKDDFFSTVWSTSTKELRENCYLALHYLMKNIVDEKKRTAWMRQLAVWRGMNDQLYPRRDYLTVSMDQCHALASSEYVTIGAHTVSHSALSKMSFENQKLDILRSVDSLEKIVKQKITVFSYPFGRYFDDFNDDTMQICRDIGINKAASTDVGIFNSDFTNDLMIPRRIVRNWDVEMFEEKINEYWKEMA